MPQIPFVFEFECEWPNDLCTAKFPFSCSEMFVPFLLRMARWKFGWTFKIFFILFGVNGQMAI